MTFDLDDVIAAPAAAAGPAARAIVRISGDGCREAARTVFRPDDEPQWAVAKFASRHAGRLRLTEPRIELPAAAYLWPTRRSYTGQPLVELHLPGSLPLVEATLAELYRSGVRPARPGEFTLRAFLAGRIDLVQAEAVLGVIDAVDHRELDLALRQLAGGLSGRLADVRADLLSLLADLEAGLDFVEEDVEFVSRAEVVRRLGSAQRSIDELLADAAERWRDAGRMRAVLAGLPNAGKSTLFNALTGGEQAIVSHIAGTTRDWLTAEIDLGGVTVELVDTAGWETATDDLAAAMQTLRAEQLEQADLIVWCAAADASSEEIETDIGLRWQLGSLRERMIVVRTKADVIADGLEIGRNGCTARVMPQDIPSPLTPLPRERGTGTGSGDGFLLAVSAVTGAGLDELRARLASEVAVERAGARQMIGSTAARGRESLAAARDALGRALAAAATGFGDEILAGELRDALAGLAAVLGAVYTDDVLDVIFSRFCIGK